MRSTLLLLAGAFLCAVFFQACKKPVVVTPQPVVSTKLKAYYAEHGYDSIIYHQDGSIRSIETREVPSRRLLADKQFVYQAGKLVEITEYDGNGVFQGKWMYTYQGNHVSQVDFSIGNTARVRYLFTYEAGRIKTRIIQEKGVSGTYVNENREEYIYLNGNIARTDIFDWETNTWQKTGEVSFDGWDSHLNTLFLHEGFPFVPVQIGPANNHLKEYHKNELGAVAETFDHQYTYDQAKRPVMRRTVRTIPGAPDEVEIVRFVY